MKRRQVLQGVAAGSVAALGIGSVAARPDAGVESAENLDEVHVAGADGKVVRTVENPTDADLDRLRAETGATEQLVSPECTVKCRDHCTRDCCGYMCDCYTCDDGRDVCDSDDCDE